MIQFEAVNQRQEAVTLFSIHGAGERREGVLAPEARSSHNASEGEDWLARDTRGDVVAVYRVSPRVELWTVASSATGLPIVLAADGVGDYNESLERSPRFLDSAGVLRAVMLFVDFSDAAGSGLDEEEIRRRLVGSAPRQIESLSFSALRLSVDPVRGWRRMPRAAADYAEPSCSCVSGGMEDYLRDAAGLHPEVDFSTYDLVYVVAAKTPALALSPAWSAKIGGGIPAPRGTVRHAVTFGFDSYEVDNDTFLLLHETYHLLGLPDLYDGGEMSGTLGGGYASFGLERWDLMADQMGDSGLLGWHRFKLGWLDPAQVVCVYGPGEVTLDLAGWTSAAGVKAVMLPVTWQRPIDHEHRAYVVEVAPVPADGADGGVLVYVVNAALPSWERPIQMRGGPDASGTDPLPAGTTFRHLAAGLEVEVSQRVGDGFRVRIEKT